MCIFLIFFLCGQIYRTIFATDLVNDRPQRRRQVQKHSKKFTVMKYNFKAYLQGKPVIFGVEKGHLIMFTDNSEWDSDAFNFLQLSSKRSKYFTCDLGLIAVEEPTAAQIIDALKAWNKEGKTFKLQIEKDGQDLNAAPAAAPAAQSAPGADGAIITAIASALNGKLNFNSDTLKEELKNELSDYCKQIIEGRAPRQVQHTFIFKDREVRAKKGEVFHAQFERICKYLMKGHAIYLHGPSGTGKSYVAKQVANVLGLTFYLINSVTQEHKITGYSDAAGVFHSTQFTEAFTKGGVLLIDEIDASVPEVLMILNEALANGRICVDGKLLEAHPDFKCITAGNTLGGGASETNGVEYTARYPLDPASLDRFKFIYFDYDRNIEATFEGVSDDMINFIWELRKIVKENNISNVLLTYRAYKRLVDAIEIEGNLTTALEESIFDRVDADTTNTIINLLPSRGNEFYTACKKIKKAA